LYWKIIAIGWFQNRSPDEKCIFKNQKTQFQENELENYFINQPNYKLKKSKEREND